MANEKESFEGDRLPGKSDGNVILLEFSFSGFTSWEIVFRMVFCWESPVFLNESKGQKPCLKSTLCRLFKNARMQGARNPEARVVLSRTSLHRRMSGTQQVGVFQRPAR